MTNKQNTIVGLCVLLLLVGCSKAHDNSTKALDTVEQETSSTWQKLREALDLSSKSTSQPTRHMPQQRYCYRAYNDILCYGHPVAGQEERLVAYQEAARTGYTIEPPPAPKAKPEKKDTQKKKDTVVEDKPPIKQANADAADKKQAEVKPSEAKQEAQKNDAAKPDSAKPVTDPVASGDATKKPSGKAEEKHLKEIIFDPKELEPKKLVPDKVE